MSEETPQSGCVYIEGVARSRRRVYRFNQVSEEQGQCQFCGQPADMGDVCTACTLTDIKVPEDLSSGAASEADIDYSRATLIESHSARKFVMKGPRCRIGRDPSNQIVIGDDAYASRFHAWVSYEDGHFFVEDLGSTNGTLLNGSPLTRRRPITSGDRLRVGRSDFTFILDPPTAMGSIAGAAAEPRGQNGN